MFSNIFSFEGRIGQKEFGFTLIVFVIGMFLIQTLSALAIGTKLLPEEIVIPVFCLLVLPIVTFLLAQGAKRCHDLGLSGWFQLIPFFAIYLLMAKSRH